MNKPLRRVAIAAMTLLVILMINVNYIQGSQADKLKNDALNNRKYLTQFQHDRGPILAGSVTLAQSTKIDKKNFQRVYKQGELYSPITGFMSVFNRTGLEGADNALLDGTDKRLTVHNWFDMLVGKKPKGATVQTTIVPKAQQAAYEGIRSKTVSRGAAVAIDVKTGAILAMASYPSFDTNLVATHDSTKAVKADARLEKASGKPMLNKAMNEVFPPGSSFKIVDSAAALESGGLTKDSPAPADELKLPESGQTLHNADGDEAKCSGSPPLISSFAASCNSTFGRLAGTLGQDKLLAQAEKFGFNKPVKVEPGMSSASANYPTKKMGGDDLARSGIGQGDVTATPLQMAMVAQSIANDGTEMKPYLVKRVTAPDQSELATAQEQVMGHPVSANTADQIQEMMRQVVASGTASATLSGQDIAGKTGTAETGRGIYEDWFVGFAPQHNPKVAFAVVTDGNLQSDGAHNAAPIALSIVQAVR
ncbi:penicillin-binding protein 2 [Actinomadura sp. DC4]|uniref:peptidoglycan D,D-transpeptidase FtsI family protein n=1 Tax=Actinomadura sp. DC4 TaxID=3055069 RepID=UPI0025B0BED6|nr:penicillin-binding protein 2 [Actinomadura sp. DC4]MDN3352956.1 penicillin-binding protein 2 [Actinomadura sp. DC4]